MDARNVRRHTWRARFFVLPVVFSLVASCGGGGDSTPTSPPPTTPPPGNPPPPTTGTISGRVTASSGGAAIDGASINTTPASGTTTSDAQGNFSIANVTAGAYTVTATKGGYSASSTTVSVLGGQTSTANIALTALAPVYSYSQVGFIQGPGGGIAGMAISPDGRLFAYGNYDDNLIRIVDVSSRQETRTLAGHTKQVTELAFGPDSRMLASTGTVNLPPVVDGSVRLWDVTTGAQLATVATPGTSMLQFSPNGSMLAGASGGDPVSIRVWSTPLLAPARTLTGVFRFVAFSPDGARVASGGRNDLLTIMDFNAGTQAAAWSGQTGWVTAAAYSANGQFLASAGEDRAIRIRNASDGTVTQTLTGHTTYPDYVAFSPDGTILASVGSGTNITRSGGGISISISSADRFIRLWNLGTGVELTRVNIGSDVLVGVAFSADWRTLVTCGNTGTIRFFQRAQ